MEKEQKAASFESAQAKTQVNDPVVGSKKSIAQARMKKVMEEETKEVWGIFRNLENPGQPHPICQRKYPGAVFKKTIHDGELCKIPLWVANWLNGKDLLADALNGEINSCGYFRHKNEVDSSGNAVPGAGSFVRRFRFESANEPSSFARAS